MLKFFVIEISGFTILVYYGSGEGARIFYWFKWSIKFIKSRIHLIYCHTPYVSLLNFF